MRPLLLISVMLGWAVLIGGPSQAQQPALPAGVPEKMPFDIPYGPTITLEHAKQVIAAAEAEAKRHDWKLAISAVDPNGDLVAFNKMDGTQLASGLISQGKARTAARFRRETRLFFAMMETGHPYVETLDPTLVSSPGGFPLVEGGKLIGAIGCGGATGDQDAVACKVGADLVK
jgi:glc operon protein GlcG